MPAFFFQPIKSAVLALFCFLALVVSAAAQEFKSEPLEIHRQDGKILHFTVELAAKEEERRQGLMNRDEMAADHGMLFDFGQSRNVFMWMKNTYLPLDMLFISEKGRIEHIKADALPLSEDIIDSHGAVHFVLELNGGTSAALGIRVGDTVTSAQIAKAAKP
jgi:uncharacterized membrane protein (UPF0127 family)